MKNTLKRFSVLMIAVSAAFGLMAGCQASERGANNQANGETVTTKPANVGGNTAENKADENKPAAKSEVLWDFRKDSYSTPPTFSKSETEAVVKYLFGERASGKIEISSRLSGAFTKPNVKETLYYLSGCKDETNGRFTTDCPPVSSGSVGWVVVYDDTTPILKFEETLGSGIEKITDVNGDGKNEFLSSDGFLQNGIQNAGAALGEISAGKYQEIKSFKGYADNCAFALQSAGKLSAVAAVITYTPTTGGQMPAFTEEYFQGQCRNQEADKSSWKPTTKKDFEEFFDSIS